MFEEEERPRRRGHFQPQSFDGWGIEDLNAHIEALKAEIQRAEAAIAGREAQRKAADAFFRTGPAG